jgi:IS1 family transposase
MNRLTGKQREQVIAALVEGNSIRATCRMTGVAKNTVVKLLSDMGLVCSIHLDRLMRDLPCKRVQVDEVWSFVGAKAKNVKADKKAEGWGDVWTWVAIDADTKLVLTYRVGARDPYEAQQIMCDVAARVNGRIQLTTDGHAPYLSAVAGAFGREVDYAMLVKLFGNSGDPSKPNRRYSPGVCLEAIPQAISSDPDPDHISTSYVERQNLTMRMSMRRFTRLTNGFSKKVENHAAAVSLHFAYYNLCRPHLSLGGKTPAMAAGVTDHVWPLSELVGLLADAEKAVPMKRGPYQKRQRAQLSK